MRKLLGVSNFLPMGSDFKHAKGLETTLVY